MATTLEEAIAHVAAVTAPLGAETVDCAEALGRVLAEPVTAPFPMPPFANSAMDGYALRAADVAGAAAGGPVRLAIAGDARAGAPLGRPLAAGETARIATGAMLPDGADAILRVEEAEIDGGALVVRAPVPAGADVRPAGDDVAAGGPVLEPGTALDAGALAMLAAVGRTGARVTRRPRVALVGTGDELVPPGRPLGPGQIHDSNLPMLRALVTSAGGIVSSAAAGVGDTRDATREAIAAAIADADLVLLSGGVSKGAHDHVRPALDELGAGERFWQLALRPGHPTWFGTASGGTPVLGLPGNPASAFTIFWLLGARALDRLSGRAAEPLRLTATYAGPDVRKRPDTVQVLRCALTTGDGGRPVARPTGSHQRSHAVSSLAGAAALALVEADREGMADGDPVTVELLGR